MLHGHVLVMRRRIQKKYTGQIKLGIKLSSQLLQDFELMAK